MIIENGPKLRKNVGDLIVAAKKVDAILLDHARIKEVLVGWGSDTTEGQDDAAITAVEALKNDYVGAFDASVVTFTATEPIAEVEPE